MRWGRPFGGLFGFLLIVFGVIIVLAMVLPPGFWWFVLGVVLISIGFCCANRR